MKCTIAPCNDACEEASDLIASLFASKDFKGAVRASQDALQADPSCPLASALLAASLFEDGQRYESLKQAKRGREAHPAAADFGFLEGKALLSLELDGEAAGPFAKAARLHPGDWPPEGLAMLAMASVGRRKEAEAAAKRLCKKNPQSAGLRRAAAHAMMSCGRYRQSVRFAQEALKLDYDLQDMHDATVRSLIMLGRISDAYEESKLLAEKYPDSAKAMVMRALVLAYLGRMSEAYASLAEAGRTSDGAAFQGAPKRAPEDPKDAVDGIVLAYALASAGDAVDYARASSELKEIPVTMMPDCSIKSESIRDKFYAHLLRANEAAREGRTGWHANLLGKAAHLDPENAVVRAQLSGALGRAGRLDESLKSADLALKFCPGSADMHNLRGAALGMLERYGEAELEFDAALKILPGHDEARRNKENVVKWMAEDGDAAARPKKRRRQARGAPKAGESAPSPPSAGAYQEAARLESANMLKEAIAEYKRASKLAPRDPYPHSRIGLIRTRLAEFEGAVRAYDEAIALEPKSEILHGNRAGALYGAGRLHDALDAFRQSLRINPGYAYANLNLGGILKQMGMDREAAPFLKAARGGDYSQKLPIHTGPKARLAAARSAPPRKRRRKKKAGSAASTGGWT